LADTRKAILSAIQGQGRLKPRDHLKSLAFGLVCGVVVIAIFLFSFFNEVIIAPFIQPSRHVSSIPLIITASTVSTSSPQVIIPKINVEIPVDYSETSTNENVIENDLEDGVVHYPDTVLPGQNGNAAFFGHSSNNIFNPGKYKFAFVLLHTLVDGDTFYLTYNDKIFVYQVVDHKVVPPNDVSVLNDTEGHQATATLITCDPPGTSINRLVVTGVQISPDPTSNTAAPATPQLAAEPATLPGNGPSLWSRFMGWLF
jgi:sortase A